MTRRTNNHYRRGNRNTATVVTLTVILLLVLAGIALIGHFKNKKQNDGTVLSGGTPTAATPAPTAKKDPVWHENAAPTDNTIPYTPPQGIEHPYYIKVNRALCTVTVYGIDQNGEYTVPVKAFACSVGREGEETILGEYSMPEAYDWCYMVDGTYSQYSYRIERGYMFHSVPCYKMTKNSLETEEYNKLGGPASLGCIRLTVADAKWIYDNCKIGTKTLIYDDTTTPGPLGKPETIKIPLTHEYAGWDPTDPDTNNPWHTMQPVIHAKSLTVPVGAEIDILRDVTATDTCGNDITSKIYWYGKYTCDIAGTYTVTYGVTDAIGKHTEQTITVTVTDGTATPDSQRPESTAAPAAVSVDGTSLKSEYAILLCRNNSAVLLDKNADQRAEPASITKIMTVLLAAENLSDTQERLAVTQETFDALAARDASMARFPIGEGVRVIDLMYGSFVVSGADASVTLANRIAGSEAKFAKLMNRKAAEIGMKNTNFVNATGLHETEQYTTCRDVALLMQYALQNPLFKEIFTNASYTTEPLPGHPSGMNFKSTMFKIMPETKFENKLTVSGGKTGYTDNAGLCLASLAKSEATGNEYILITMKAPGSYWDEPYPNHVGDAMTVYKAIQEG